MVELLSIILAFLILLIFYLFFIKPYLEKTNYDPYNNQYTPYNGQYKGQYNDYYPNINYPNNNYPNNNSYNYPGNLYNNNMYKNYDGYKSKTKGEKNDEYTEVLNNTIMKENKLLFLKKKNSNDGVKDEYKLNSCIYTKNFSYNNK